MAQINFPESGRGLGRMTATIFGSTVGYPSDSLASCLCYILHLRIVSDINIFLSVLYGPNMDLLLSDSY